MDVTPTTILLWLLIPLVVLLLVIIGLLVPKVRSAKKVKVKVFGMEIELEQEDAKAVVEEAFGLELQLRRRLAAKDSFVLKQKAEKGIAFMKSVDRIIRSRDQLKRYYQMD